MDETHEHQWRQTLVEIEVLRQKYAELARSENVNDSELNLLWLRLWQAERRRDEILRSSE